MAIPTEVTFHDLDHSDAVEAAIDRRRERKRFTVTASPDPYCPTQGGSHIGCAGDCVQPKKEREIQKCWDDITNYFK